MSPQFVDWNGDGHLDALLGGFGGDVMLFLGKRGGGFHAGSQLAFENGQPFTHLIEQGNGKDPKEDAGAMIWCEDWDQDGDLDLLSGWFYGGIFLNRNLGTKTEPKLSPDFEAVQAGDGNTDWGYQVQPSMADWDGDGRKDLIYSSQAVPKSGQGSVSWCRNLSEAGEPRLAAPEVLVWSGLSTQIISPELGLERVIGGFLAAVPTDWDSDGDIDLIISDTVWLAQPKAALSAGDQKRLKEILAKTAAGKAYVPLGSAERRVVNRELTKERNELTEAKSGKAKRGQLWLLRRKAKLPMSSEQDPIALGLRSKNLGDGRHRLTVQGHVLDGWHAYGDVPEGSSYVPLKLQLQLPDGFAFEGEWTRPVGHPDLNEIGLTLLEGGFTFECTVVTDPTAKLPATITCEASYQVCDDLICKQPSKKKLEVSVDK
ncbi:MAG: FG-GAP-like repeat-containing protein [Verrucomicrobiales bacterium]